MTLEGVPTEEAETDLDEIDKYVFGLEGREKRFVTGEMMPDEEGWV